MAVLARPARVTRDPRQAARALRHARPLQLRATFRAGRRAGTFGRSARGGAVRRRPAAWPAAGAERPVQVGAALALGRFEGGGARVYAFGVEHGSVAAGVGWRKVDGVFTHALRELGERRAPARAVEPPCAAAE